LFNGYWKDEIGRTCNTYEIMLGKPEGKRPLGRPRHGWKDAFKIDRSEVVLVNAFIWLMIGASGRLL
jgi:hypothetical protein